jgi:lipopolysaccharide exporter
LPARIYGKPAGCPVKILNFKSDLVATAFCFLVSGVARLASSLILTRMLYPEAYGTIAVISSIVFAIEMVSDIGVAGFMVRDKNGDNPKYINTVWTVRLIRSLVNLSILFVAAAPIADLYGVPALTNWLRLFCLWFLFYGFESMSFVLAVRHKRARIATYSELGCTLVSIVFVIAFSYYSRDESGMVYGMLLERILRTAASYFFYRDQRPRLQYDREAAGDLFGFSKYVMPSSWLSLLLGQFDKIIFLKLFDLKLLGLYGLANGIAGPVDALTTQVSRTVLFARCAANFRACRDTFCDKYYRENLKLFLVTLFLPAAVGGSAHFIVQLLYDPRYALAGMILQAFAIRSMLVALSGPAENMLAAANGSKVVLVGNLCRVAWLVPAALAGYHFAGFNGFIYAVALKELPPLIYFFWRQHREHFLIARFEALKIAFMAAVFMVFSLLGPSLAALRPVLLNLWTLVRA